MPQPPLSQDRVIDPLLTEVARGYSSPNSPIANRLFPLVPVGQRAGAIIAFGPEDFILQATKRAPGATTKRVQFGYDKGTYGLADHSLEGVSPIERMEEAAAVPGLNLGTITVNKVQNIMATTREKEAADLARNATNYPSSNKTTLTGADQWNDPASDPVDDVQTAKEVVRSQIGKYPTTMEVSPLVLKALRNHPAILDRLSTATDRSPATIAQLIALFEVREIIVGDGVYWDGNQFQDIWGKDAILAYTDIATATDMGEPSYGYTYQLRDYPFVEEPYFDRPSKSWIFPVTDARQPQLVGPTAGFLFKGAVA